MPKKPQTKAKKRKPEPAKPQYPNQNLFKPTDPSAPIYKPEPKKKKNAKMPMYESENEWVTHNIESQWSSFKELRDAADRAWHKLKEDIKRKAPMATLLEDRSALTLLLGECNYMARECMSFLQRKK